MQLIMTFLMSLSMSFIMYCLAVGPTQVTFQHWLLQWACAWPIAFIMTQIVARIAMPLSMKLRRKLG